MSGRTLVLGDVHGAYKALVQVLERSKFNPEKDKLIFVGDVVDGWPESKECIDLLLSIPDRVCLLGNHDEWFLDWINGQREEPVWVHQGGHATLESYDWERGNVPDNHREYMQAARRWHVEGDRAFVHAGWNYKAFSHPKDDDPLVLNWDRNMWHDAIRNEASGRVQSLTPFREVYVGHTTTTRISSVPVRCCEIWNLDQGAGWEGKLSIMDIDSKEFWQSDLVPAMYPEASGRRSRTT